MSDQDKNLSPTARAQVKGYILAAFGFVAGLAWNEAIKAAIDALVPVGTDTLVAKFIYAIAATAILILVSFILTRKKK